LRPLRISARLLLRLPSAERYEGDLRRRLSPLL
jgi:hypothetical protein